MAASFDHFKDMNDVMFKARRLGTLIKECVPDEQHSIGDVNRILNEIRTHHLLSEFEADSIDTKSRERWKRAVDLWEERLLALLSSDSPDKCWFGISFLGLTCELCSSKRFEASYTSWFQKLLPLVQLPGASDSVKAALWCSLSDMLTRLALSHFPDGKRDAISFSGKLVQPLLKFLDETKLGDAMEGAVQLLCTLLNFFPTSVHRYIDAFESSLVANLLLEKDSDKLRTLAKCLAQLPKSKGDDSSWSSMMQKLLISINLHLKDAFQGLEEDCMCDEAIRRLVPPGVERQLPLGGHRGSAEAAESASKNLLLCCLEMLTSSYSAPVTVPVESLLALIERVLMVDGSLAKSAYPFITVMQQECICSQLLILHEHCFDLLKILMTTIGSQLLPHISKIVRLLEEYLNRCALPGLRVKVYSNLRIMLDSMGSGLAVYISNIVMKNASADLQPFFRSVEGRLSKNLKMVSKEPLLVPCKGKRKHSAATESPNHQRGVGCEAKAHSEESLTVMIAALKALRALLFAGGVSKDEKLQLQVHELLINVANAACKGGWAKEAIYTNSPNTLASTVEDFQVASLIALQASFLSSTRVQPPHFSQGIELFRRGQLEVGTEIAKVCAVALGSLEVLIHPRARTVADFDNSRSAYQKGNIMGMGIDEPDAYEDNLYRSWLENEDEAEIPTVDSNNKEDSVKQPLQNAECPQPEKFSSELDDTRPSADGAQTVMAVDVGTEKVTETTDEVMTERKQLQEPVSLEGPSSPGVPLVGVMSASQLPTDNASVSPMKNPTSALHADQVYSSTTTTTTTVASTATTKMFELYKLDNADDMDSFPDIVDADPDSDSDSD
ncbi:hypothetical protein QQ045_004935 [Rhodiola kirilowii]